MRKLIIGSILIVLFVLLMPSVGRIFLMFWVDKTVYEIKEGIKTAGYKYKSKEELKPIVREYVSEINRLRGIPFPHRYVLFRSLPKTGKKGVEILVEILKDKEEGKNMVKFAYSGAGEINMRLATVYVIDQIEKCAKEGNKDFKKMFELFRDHVPTLIEILLYDEDVTIRAETASILGHIGDNRAVEPLIKALNDPGKVKVIEWRGYSGVHYDTYTYPVRQSAASALADIGDSRAIEPMIEALRKYGVGGGALARLAPERAVEPLIEAHLKSGGEEESLAKIGDRRAVRPMIQRIREEKDELNRDRQIKYLGKLGGSEAVDFLLQELKEHKYACTEYILIEALGDTKDPRAIEPLRRLLDRTEAAWERVPIAAALANLGDKGAIKPLKELLKTVDKGTVLEDTIKEALKKLQ